MIDLRIEWVLGAVRLIIRLIRSVPRTIRIPSLQILQQVRQKGTAIADNQIKHRKRRAQGLFI